MRACRGAGCALHADLADAAGGTLHARVPGGARQTTFLELCKTPSLAAEVTVTAAERLGVDAAIIFADILLILEPMGIDLEFAEGEGPVIHNPVRNAADVDRLREVEDADALDFVYEAIALNAARIET